MGNIRIPLETDCYYHIYNHAIGKESLFITDENFLYFLRKYSEHITAIADTFAYCLMPNHFHFIVRIKSGPFINPRGFKNPEGLKQESLFLSQTFGNLFNSYTKSFNKQQDRKGKLFLDNFERKHINTEDYLRKAIHYIHFNPVYHGFVDNIKDWKYSSFRSFLTEKETTLKRDEVIIWFDNLENFLAYHRMVIDEDIEFES